MARESKSTDVKSRQGRLSAEDLIRDEPLDRIAGSTSIPDELDLLNHRETARRVAELAGTAVGQLNIAVFGPWGAGKSSFLGMLEQELKGLAKPLVPLRFDAWQNSGIGFRENFLADISEQLGVPGMDERLFSVKRSVKLPFVPYLSKKGRGIFFAVIVALGLAILIGLPLLHTTLSGAPSDFWERFWPNWIGWLSVGASSSLIFLVLSSVASLAKVDVEDAQPSYVSQFRGLFRELLDGRPKEQRFAILIDELDRCDPKDVMVALEGLRTFLGHHRCVFVVAFDRAAVAEAIREHSSHRVPLRHGGAYYSTAGEYLDKIFQFQVSLPPQPINGLRRYALSLVEGKEGIWSLLRSESPQLLSRVVRLLSPIHVRSPRRTKVLLNDYAINMRLYQSMGFDCLERAEEIAAWTVIQTEFPGFATLVQVDTRMLGRAIHEVQDAAAGGDVEDIKHIDLGAVETDVVVGASLRHAASSDDESSHAPASTGGEAAERIREELRNELRSYLRRLVELDVTLPRADLILMHASGRLLEYNDPLLYNLLQDVAAVPRSAMAEALANATRADQTQALTHLLEQLEADPPEDERADLLVAVGEAASLLPLAELDAFSYQLRQSWVSPSAERSEIARSSSAASGFLRCFIDVPSEDFRKALSLLPTADALIAAEVVARLVEEAPDEAVRSSADYLLCVATPAALSEPHLLGSVLMRVDSTGDVGLSEFSKLLSGVFSDSEPEPATPSRRAARGSLPNEVDGAGAESPGKPSDAYSAFSSLAARQYREAGSARRALNDVLLGLSERVDWALRLHDELLVESAPSISIVQRNADILVAIAALPRIAPSRWIGLLDTDTPTQASHLESALDSVVQVWASSADPEEQAGAVESARKLLALRTVDDDLKLEKILLSAREILDSPAWPSTRVKTGLELLREFEVVDPELEELLGLQEELVLAAVSAVDAASAPELLNSAPKLKASVRSRVATRLLPTSGDFSTSLVVRCQVGAGFTPEELVAPSLVIARHSRDPQVVDEWMKAGPFAADLLAVRMQLGPGAINLNNLTAWAAAAAIGDRTELWRQLVLEGEFELALAAAGEEISDSATDFALNALAEATSASAREVSLEPLHSVPAGSKAYARVVAVAASSLATAGTQQDLATLFALLERDPRVSAPERARLRAQVEGMVAKHPNTLSRQKQNTLIALGFLNPRGLGGLFGRRPRASR